MSLTVGAESVAYGDVMNRDRREGCKLISKGYAMHFECKQDYTKNQPHVTPDTPLEIDKDQSSARSRYYPEIPFSGEASIYRLFFALCYLTSIFGCWEPRHFLTTITAAKIFLQPLLIA